MFKKIKKAVTVTGEPRKMLEGWCWYMGIVAALSVAGSVASAPFRD